MRCCLLVTSFICWNALARAAVAEIQRTIGDVVVTANMGGLLSGALAGGSAIADQARGPGSAEAYGWIKAEWTTDRGLAFGALASGETASNRADTLSSNRMFCYIAEPWGRLEAGLTTGAARRMSFYAPVVGSGQVRGDFARYAGVSTLPWPLGISQSLKIVYFAPPSHGFGVGASWAPKVMRFGATQKDVLEVGLQYERPVSDWIVGASWAYVHSQQTLPRLQGINNWSVGLLGRRGKIVIGGAYIIHGSGNVDFSAFERKEINAGISWREAKWRLALSGARTRARRFQNDFIGLGGSYDLTAHVTFNTDLVGLRQRDVIKGDRSGFVVVSEIDLHL